MIKRKYSELVEHLEYMVVIRKNIQSSKMIRQQMKMNANYGPPARYREFADAHKDAKEQVLHYSEIYDKLVHQLMRFSLSPEWGEAFMILKLSGLDWTDALDYYEKQELTKLQAQYNVGV